MTMQTNSATIALKVLGEKNFDSAMKRIAKTMGKVRAAMEGVARVAKKMMIAGVAAATAITVAFARFEVRMARVAALTEATAQDFQKLERFARKMGESTVFSANQAAEAMASFALQGFKTEEIIAALPPTLDLAAAGAVSMEMAARITAGVMRGMKIDAGDLTRVVDVLAKATVSSATDIPMLGEAMRGIGPVAQAAGLSLEQTTAALRVFADVMIQGRSAGTALRNILLRLQKQPSEVRKRLEQLNITVIDAKGNLNDLATIVDKLNGAMQGMGRAQKSAVLADLADLRAVAAFTELLNIGGDTLRQYTKELENAGGTAKRVADLQIDTLHGAFKLLISAATELAIVIGNILEPTLRRLMKSITETIKSISSLDKEFVALSITIAGLAGAIGLLLIGLPTVVGIVRLLIRLTPQLTVLIAAARYQLAVLATGPWLPILAAVTTISLLAKQFADLKEKTAAARAEIENISQASVDINQANEKLSGASDLSERLEGYREKIAAFRARSKELVALANAVAEDEGTFDYSQRRAVVINAIKNATKYRDAANKLKERADKLEKRLADRGGTLPIPEPAVDKAYAALLDDVDALESKLRLQLDTWGMTAEQAAIVEMNIRGVGAEQLKHAQKLAGYIQQWRELDDEIDRNVKLLYEEAKLRANERKKLDDRANALKRTLMTKKELLKEAYDEINMLRIKTALTLKEADALKKLAKARIMDADARRAGGLEDLIDTHRRILAMSSSQKTKGWRGAINPISGQRQSRATPGVPGTRNPTTTGQMFPKSSQQHLQLMLVELQKLNRRGIAARYSY